MKTKRSKIGRRGKTMLAVLIAIMFVSVASAAYLTYYNTITVEANVEQSVLVDGKDVNDPINQPLPAIGGWTYYFKHNIENRAPIDATVSFDTSYDPWTNRITTSIYALKESKTTLILENKDGDWNIIDDTTQATLTFDTVANDFNYEFEATGLEATTKYCLIYYADQPDRYVNWGGDNPGKLIATFTTDGTGDIAKTTANVNLGMNLPESPDANINEYNYGAGTPDNYDHNNGAKIWLVPLDCYSEPEVTTWSPSRFLFETDLIIYLDCNIPEVEYSVGKIIVEQYAEDKTAGLTIGPGEMKHLLFGYEFALDIHPDPYKIITEIQPLTS